MMSARRDQVIGSRILRLGSVTSTNDLAREYAERGEEEGLVIWAEEQTAGRGRMGRRWLAPSRTSLQFSILLRPPISSQKAIRLTQFSALAIVQTLRDELGLSPTLKWHNDVLLGSKKCGGILVESRMEEDHIISAVVGIGLNVNFTMQQAVPELASIATTISDELGRNVDREALASALLANLDRSYSHLCAGQDLTQEWRSQLSTIGTFVRIQSPWGNEEGVARDVDADGSLLLEQPDGTIAKVAVGEVIPHREPSYVQ